VLLLFSFSPADKTVKYFDINVAGVKVGTLIATCETKDGTTTYNLTSDVDIHIVKHYRIKDEVNSVFKDGKLQLAITKTSIGSKKYYSDVVWNKDHYDVNINTHKYHNKSTEINPILFSGAMMYFMEPPADTKVFSEVYGAFSTVMGLEDTHRRILKYLGKTNTYYYTYGTLRRVEIQNSPRDFILVPK
jgi:hypothetical protein